MLAIIDIECSFVASFKSSNPIQSTMIGASICILRSVTPSDEAITAWLAPLRADQGIASIDRRDGSFEDVRLKHLAKPNDIRAQP